MRNPTDPLLHAQADDLAGAGPAGASWLVNAKRVVRDDMWAKGFRGTWQTIFRMLRMALHWRSHRQWCGVIGGPTTRRILQAYPRIVYIHSFTYLFASATWPQRLSMVKSHYAFLNRMHGPAFFDRVISPGGLALWQRRIDGHDMSIALSGPCLVSRHHEGDLTLAFIVDGATLCRMAFSIIGADAVQATAAHDQRLIYVGQVQGAPGAHDAIREATSLMQAIAPRDLLMSAIAGAAQAWGIDTLFGVADDQLLSREALKNSSSRFDYGKFWLDHGGAFHPDGHYVVRLPIAVKALSSIAAKHRRRTAVKRAVKLSVSAAVHRAIDGQVIRTECRRSEGSIESTR